jgi:hypothetical protein
MTQHLHLVAFLWIHRQGVWRANSETGLNARFYLFKAGSMIQEVKRPYQDQSTQFSA